MSRSLKKQIGFFLIVLCGMIGYNYIATRPVQDKGVYSDVQEYKRVLMQKRAENVKNHAEGGITDQ